MDRAVTTNGIAGRLGVTPGEVRRLLRTGRLRGTKRGRTWRVRQADLDDFLTEPFVEQGMLAEAESRRRTSTGGLTLQDLKTRLGL